LGYFCEDCRRWVTKEKGYAGVWIALDHPDLSNIDVDALPFLDEFLRYRQCEWCGEAGLCEVHHAAPQKFFGEDAELFPMVYLCRPCHERWHGVVTPGLCTRYDAPQHAHLLASYLSRDQIRALALALHRRLAAEAA